MAAFLVDFLRLMSSCNGLGGLTFEVVEALTDLVVETFLALASGWDNKVQVHIIFFCVPLTVVASRTTFKGFINLPFRARVVMSLVDNMIEDTR